MALAVALAVCCVLCVKFPGTAWMTCSTKNSWKSLIVLALTLAVAPRAVSFVVVRARPPCGRPLTGECRSPWSRARPSFWLLTPPGRPFAHSSLSFPRAAREPEKSLAASWPCANFWLLNPSAPVQAAPRFVFPVLCVVSWESAAQQHQA